MRVRTLYVALGWLLSSSLRGLHRNLRLELGTCREAFSSFPKSVIGIFAASAAEQNILVYRTNTWSYPKVHRK